jgi:surface protein
MIKGVLFMGSFENDGNSKPNKSKSIGKSPVPAYQGDEPYIFVSYSHDDSDRVFPELERFHNDGFNVWYDEGIVSGEGWHGFVERALLKSSLVVFFVSDNAIESKNVRNEIFLAANENIPIILIYLEDAELREGLKLTLETAPPIRKYDLSEEKYVSNYRKEFEQFGFVTNESPILDRINNPPFPPYQGDEPYIFVSYSHDDSDRVFPELVRFNDDGYNVWYDEGIISGEGWQAAVEKALLKSSLFLVFISRASVASENVRKEIFLADGAVPIIPIFLEATNLEGDGLKLKLGSVQSIYKHKITEERFIEKYRQEFAKRGFEVRKARLTNTVSQVNEDDENYQIIKLIVDNISALDEETVNDFDEMIGLYNEAISNQNEGLLEFVSGELKSIFNGIYVNEYLEHIRNAPKKLKHPSLKLNIRSDSIKHGIIRTAFLELEKSDFTNQTLADELLQQGHSQMDNDDFNGLEETVVQLYKESQNRDETTESPQENVHESENMDEFEKMNATTGSIDDLGENEVLIILKDGTNITSWSDVEDTDDILYLSEDLSGYIDLSEKYKDFKSLKAIVATNVTDIVTNMRDMFSGCSSLEDISSLKDWDTTNVEDMNGMFKGCSSLEDISALRDWNCENVEDMNGMFDGCTSLKDISALKDWNTANVADISGMFYGCGSLIDMFSLKNWDTSSVKFMSRMFRGCSSLADLSALKNWNLTNVSDMNSAFKGCSSLTDIFSLKNWNVGNVSDLSGLFYDCSSLDNILSLKNWKTKNVADMNCMFKGCSSVGDISPLKDWKTGNVVDMSSMFEECSSLEDIFPLKNWNTKKLKDMTRMFYNCSSLVDGSALKNWDIHNVVYKNEMFEGCSNIKELPKWY